MYLASVEEAVKLEKLTAGRVGSTFSLMERVGLGIAEHIDKSLARKSNITVVCGSGNNAGDGLIAARILNRKNHQVKVFACSDPTVWKGDAAEAYRILKQNQPGVKIYNLNEAENHRMFEKNLAVSDVIIDAIFGTGLSRAVEGTGKFAIDAIIRFGRGAVFSVDISSGVHAGTGRIMGSAVQASTTLTAGIAKYGSVLYPGARCSGQIEILDMGIETEDIRKTAKTKTVTEKMVREWLPKREPDVHKKAIGRVGVLAGSAGMGGAAYLCATAAIKSGAGIVYLLTPRSLASQLQAKLTEIVIVPLSEGNAGSLSLMSSKQIGDFSKELDVMVIGPGLSTRPETVSLVRQIVGSLDIPLVIDADGLNALAGQASVLKNRTKPTVITPHSGEMARLRGVLPGEIENDRIGVATDSAFSFGSVVVLKGARTVISSPNQTSYITLRGNAGMASAGTGDVLAGMIGSFIGQGVEPFSAAALAADIHAHSGDFAKEELSEYYMTASNLIDYLPKVFKYYDKKI